MFFGNKLYLKILAVAIASAGLAIGQLACAAQNHDAGSIAHKKFDNMDIDKNGIVILEEFRAAYPGMNESAFKVIDKNGSNGIERAEWFEFMENHGKGSMPPERRGAPMNNIPGDPLIPPPDSDDLPLVRPPSN